MMIFYKKLMLNFKQKKNIINKKFKNILINLQNIEKLVNRNLNKYSIKIFLKVQIINDYLRNQLILNKFKREEN